MLKYLYAFNLHLKAHVRMSQTKASNIFEALMLSFSASCEYDDGLDDGLDELEDPCEYLDDEHNNGFDEGLGSLRAQQVCPISSNLVPQFN